LADGNLTGESLEGDKIKPYVLVAELGEHHRAFL
jgi:hypothetical protein